MNRRNLLMGLCLACVAQAVDLAYADGGSGPGGSGGSSNSGSGSSGNGGGDDDDADDDDWDDAAMAVERGEILPLQSILKIALANTPGKVIGVKLIHRGAAYVYLVKILDKTGRKVELAIDAHSRNVTKVR